MKLQAVIKGRYEAYQDETWYESISTLGALTHQILSRSVEIWLSSGVWTISPGEIGLANGVSEMNLFESRGHSF